MPAQQADARRAFWLIHARCANRCVYCGVERLGPAPALTAALAARIAARLIEAGVTEVVLAGGEPLLAPALGAALDALRGRCMTALCTGGVPDVAGALAVLRAGIGRIAVSIDAGDDALNDRLRGRPGVTRDALALAEAVRREGIADMAFTTVVSRHNATALGAVWERIAPLRPSSWALALVGEALADPTPHRLDRAQLERFYARDVPELAERAGGAGTPLVVLPVPLPFLEDGAPPSAWGRAAVRRRAELARELDRYALGDFNRSFVERYGCPLAGEDVIVGVAGEVYPCSQPTVIRPEHVVGETLGTALREVLSGPAARAFVAGVPHACCARCWAPSNVAPEALRARVAVGRTT